MELTIAKDELLRALQRTHGVADRKGSMAILQNVLLEADASGKLRAAATDLYLGVSAQCEAQVAEPGAVAVGARVLLDIVKRLPEGEVALASDGGSAQIRCGSVRYKLTAAPGEDFPPLPNPGEAAFVAVPVEALKELIARTAYSMSTDDTRPHLAGALFEAEGERLRMVTTDGHRLSKAERPVGGLQASFSMLVPHKGVAELRRLIEAARAAEGEEAVVEVAQEGAHAFFRADDVLLGVKLTEERFPPYEKVIPSSHSRRVVLSREAFREALGRMSLLTPGKSDGVKLELAPGSLTVAAESPELGEGREELQVDFAGDPLAIGFNARYLMDVLGALPHDEVVFELGGELDPGVLRPAGEDEQRFVGVVMPMRL